MRQKEPHAEYKSGREKQQAEGYVQMEKLTHLSLFSGIGGLDLAAEWSGITTVGQCEWAEYPTKVLEKHWPGVSRWRDIRTLTGDSFYERTGLRTVDVISGGFPCQPFSVAGKQRGKEDDRYLWPEMVRVIKELRPTWVVGENVTGIIKMALPDILSELEACGYRTRVFHIPASGVGARHHRYRVAIVGHAEHNRLSATAVAGGVETSGRGQQEGQDASGKFEGAGEPGDGTAMGRAENLENASCRRCSKPENVCEQPRGAEPERASEVVADAQSIHERRLPIRKEQAVAGFSSSGKDVQHTDCTGRKEQHTSEKSDESGFFGGGCDAGNVCNTAGQGLPDGPGIQVGGHGTQEQEPERPDCNVSDTDRSTVMRRRPCKATSGENGECREHNRDGKEEHAEWQRRSAQPGLGRMADGISGRMDRDLDFIINHYWDDEPDVPRTATGIPDRVGRLKALGNAVVPQQFYPIFQAIADTEEAITQLDNHRCRNRTQEKQGYPGKKVD